MGGNVSLYEGHLFPLSMSLAKTNECVNLVHMHMVNLLASVFIFHMFSNIIFRGQCYITDVTFCL